MRYEVSVNDEWSPVTGHDNTLTSTYLEVCLGRDYKGTQEEQSRRHILSKNNGFSMFIFEILLHTLFPLFASSSVQQILIYIIYILTRKNGINRGPRRTDDILVSVQEGMTTTCRQSTDVVTRNLGCQGHCLCVCTTKTTLMSDPNCETICRLT